MKIPANLLRHVEAELEGLDYGAVTIQVSNGGKTMDVITERRQRFQSTSCEGGLEKKIEKSFREG